MKYLALIRSVALRYQHQRPVKVAMFRERRIEYIEATLDDIATANRIAHEVLGRSLDELPPQTRRLLVLIDEMVTAECARLSVERSEYRFSRRDVRAHTGWGDTQLRVHLRRLEELEYVAVHRGGRGQSFVYELLFEAAGDGSSPVLAELIDVARLKYDAERAGREGENAGRARGESGPMAAGPRAASEPLFTGVALHYAAAEA